MLFVRHTFPLLFGIFLLSVAVRLPELNRPLSRHHEFCTSISLRVMQIWYDNGIAKYGYNPAMNFNNPADKFINNSANTTGKMVDTAGNFYYVSHPPFAYYFPFFIFKALHIRPDVLPLQIINLLLNLISALFVYFTVCLLSFNRARSMPYRPALIAFIIYLFLPVTLWFQGNVYMSDMAVHTLFVIGVYTALKMIIRQKFYSPKYIFFYVTCLALMIYTSWLGIFFAFGIMVYSLLQIHEVKSFRVLLYSTLITTLIMLRLVFYQYSQINGPYAYIEEMLHRYLLRGSLQETDRGLTHFMFSYLWLLKTILYNYFIHYIVVYIIIGLFIWLAFTRKKLKIVFSANGYKFIWLAVLPIMAMHIFFLNYSVQDFTVLYASLFFSVLLGILYDKVKKSGAVPLNWLRMGVGVTIILFVAQYYAMNFVPFLFAPKFAAAKLDYEYQKSGYNVAAKSARDEVVFIQGRTPEPQEVFYAQRNIRFAKSPEDAIDFLRQHHLSKGIIFGDHKILSGGIREEYLDEITKVYADSASEIKPL